MFRAVYYLEIRLKSLQVRKFVEASWFELGEYIEVFVQRKIGITELKEMHEYHSC